MLPLRTYADSGPSALKCFSYKEASRESQLIHEGPERNSIAQRILRGVNTKLKSSVLLNWRPGHFSFFILTLSQEAYLEALNPWHVGCLAQQK
jgi:hypothetical protein